MTIGPNSKRGGLLLAAALMQRVRDPRTQSIQSL